MQIQDPDSIPPTFNRLYNESRKNQNPRFLRKQRIRKETEEIEWQKRLDAQNHTVRSSRPWGCPSQKKIKRPPLIRTPRTPERPKSERIPSYNNFRKIVDAGQKADVMNMSAPIKKFPLPPLDYGNLNNVLDKPRSSYLFWIDMRLGM